MGLQDRTDEVKEEAAMVIVRTRCCTSCSLFFMVFVIVLSWFFMKLYFKELDFKELGVLGYLLGVLGYSDLLGMGVLGYSDLLGLGVPDEWLLDLLVEPHGPHGAGDHMGPMDRGELGWQTPRRLP